jgi:CrcB protein
MIALGGAAGTLLRHGLTIGLGKSLGTQFPFGTLLANLVGSLLLAVVAEALAGATIAGTDARLVLGVGVLGGFTTYSSFNLELLRMLEQGAHGRALLYLGATLGGCLLAGILGLAIARVIVDTP